MDGKELRIGQCILYDMLEDVTKKLEQTGKSIIPHLHNEGSCSALTMERFEQHIDIFP